MENVSLVIVVHVPDVLSTKNRVNILRCNIIAWFAAQISFTAHRFRESKIIILYSCHHKTSYIRIHSIVSYSFWFYILYNVGRFVLYSLLYKKKKITILLKLIRCEFTSYARSNTHSLSTGRFRRVDWFARLTQTQAADNNNMTLWPNLTHAITTKPAAAAAAMVRRVQSDGLYHYRSLLFLIRFSP